jgi:hypothetical protein
MDGAMETVRLAVPDAEVARLVAREFEDALDRWGQEHPGPFYAATLWVDEVYGYFAFNTADQTDYEQRCARFTGLTNQELLGPGYRWYSGDWSTQPQDFLSPETTETLAPLAEFVNDDSNDVDALELVWPRWHAIAYDAVRQVRVPPTLSTTPDHLVYVERDDLSLVETAWDMLRTMPAARFHEVIPAWRQLAAAARVARNDPELMARVRQQSADEPVHPVIPGTFPLHEYEDPDVARLATHLRPCGLALRDLADWTNGLQSALAVADAGSSTGSSDG